MSKKNSNQKGITLIALVVTIIVLIILATISINAVLGENGLIKIAEQAKEIQANAEAKEAEEMNKLAEELKKTNWDFSKITKVISEDNVYVPVPKGYVASTIDGEKSVANGFVIKEGKNGASKSGINEFVWVPVSNINDIYDAENDAGQLWSFSGTTSTKIKYPTMINSGNREPDVITGATKGEDSTSGVEYDAVSENLQQAGLPDTATVQDFKLQLQQEFKSMIESVKIYGGFYIGRYETGNLNQKKAVVQKYNTDIGDQTWYTQYKLSKTIAANSSVTTSMIWGCQWDATLRWMQTSNIEKVKNFPTNSAAYGNYNDNKLTYKESESGESKIQSTASSKIPTGGSETTNINNIYDMAGNVLDWLIEANMNNCRTGGGAYYYHNGSCTPSMDRNVCPTDSRIFVGSRATLYITQ